MALDAGEFGLTVGMVGTTETQVTTENTADKIKSGTAPVFSTPMMIGLMESAAVVAVEKNLPEGVSTVGTLVNIKHLAATPIGQTVRAEATLTSFEGRRLTFAVVAYDQNEKIGEGIHERALIDTARFLARVQAK